MKQMRIRVEINLKPYFRLNAAQAAFTDARQRVLAAQAELDAAQAELDAAQAEIEAAQVEVNRTCPVTRYS